MSTFASRDGTVLHETLWPAEKPKGSVAIVHGYFEHMGRYDHVGKALSARGFTAHGLDWRGHGQSAGQRGLIMRFDEYLDDLQGILGRATERPQFLLAHSMGGLAACTYLVRRGAGELSGVVLSSPWLATKLKVPAVKVLAGKIASKIYPKLTIPGGLKGSDCARDPEIAAGYDSDPLGFHDVTARFWTEAAAAQEECFARAREIKLPLFMMQGGDDHVADAQVSKAVFEKMGSTDKSLSMLEGQYHEVFNEPPEIRKKNLDAVCDWLDAHAAAGASEKVARS
jgi:alpha-beta hydrolase superfamily lysophospholipase